MNRLIIDLEALRQNVATVDAWVRAAGARWTVVTKALCGDQPVLRALYDMGVRSAAESRLANLPDVRAAMPDAELWYLRPAHPSAVPEIVAQCQVSLASEIETLRLIDAEAARRGALHRVVVMVELGDRREGVLPGYLLSFMEQALRLSHIRVIGLGTNLGCLAGVLPSHEHYAQLLLFRELIELKFGVALPVVSAGTSVSVPALRQGRIPAGVNHYRIGEAVLLGTDLVSGGTIPGLRDDVVTLRAEIAELKRKPVAAGGEVGGDVHPFPHPGGAHADRPGRRAWRALVTIGQYDADVTGLVPLDPRFAIAGASSDMTVVTVGDHPAGLCLGDEIAFRLRYGALLRLMGSRYVAKVLEPGATPWERPLDLAHEPVHPTRRHARPLDPMPTPAAIARTSGDQP